MTGKYNFKDQDITTDVLFKIEKIISILAEKDSISFDDAYENFISSNTYNILKNIKNLYWAESAEFIADEYYREKTKVPCAICVYLRRKTTEGTEFLVRNLIFPL